MAFSLLAAADVAGDKQNFEIQFNSHPTIGEVETNVTAAYQGAYPNHSFSISRMQYYDERAQRWSDLVSASCLKDYMQIYVFNRGTVEVQKPIPPPRRPPVYHTSVPRGPGISPGGPAGGESMMLSDDAPLDEKMRVVFEELDANKNRTIEPDEFRRGFRVNNLEFSANTVTDLFGKADVNGDGLISFAEFQRFSEIYPTLLDSLYFRIRDYWEDLRQKQNMNASRESLEACKESERSAQVAYREAQEATVMQEKRLESAESAVAEAAEAEQQAKAQLQEMHRELEATMRDRAQKVQELELAREKERQRVGAHGEAQRETEDAEQALAWQEAEQAKAQDRERQAANALVEAQKETERARKLEADTAVDLQAARDREQQANLALLEEKRQTEVAAERLQQLELELQQKNLYEKELEQNVAEALADVDVEKRNRDESERALQVAREDEREANVRHLDAVKLIEEQEKKIVAIEAERQAAIQRRQQVEAQERPLLEQEVRLREQRDSLEEKESRLREEANAFHSFRGGQRY